MYKGQGSSKQVERMVREAEEWREEDERERQRILAKNQLEEKAFQLKSKLESDGKQNTSDVEDVSSLGIDI